MLTYGLEDAILAKIYAWWTPLTTVFWDKHRESLSTNVRQDNSARELLKNPEFKVWLDQVGKTLWCTGMRKCLRAYGHVKV
jgi:hypothetical protein